jgi:rhamnulokinase
MSAPVRLAIDLGASSGRVIAGSFQPGRLVLQEIHRFVNQPVSMAGSLQWDLHSLWEEIQNGLSKAAKQFDQIKSVGADTWGVDIVLLRSDGLQAGPVFHYRDPRNVGKMQVAFSKVPREKIFELTGLQFMEINTLYQLISERAVKGGALEAAEHLLMMGDFFHYLLSGKVSLEATNASTTQLLDPRNQTWATELLQAFDLPEHLFKPVTQPGTKLGPVSPDVAKRTGLCDVPVIIPATHDTASAVLSVPTNSFAPEKPDWCYISSGTWSLMGCELNHPKINDLCSELNFTNEGGPLGSTRLLKNIGGLWVVQQIRASLLRQGDAPEFSEMVEAARMAPANVTVIDPDDPSLVAPADMIEAVQTLAQRTGQPIPQGVGPLCRAAFEGLAARYRLTLEKLERLVGNPIHTIHIVGGGSQNEFLCQMTADACNRTVVAGPVEATAIGNLVMQAIGDGELKSIVDARRLVLASFETKTYQPIPSQIDWATVASHLG